LFQLLKFLRVFVFRPSEEVEENWAEVTVDKENDVIGLACSFLGFLSFRFALVGHIPPINGQVVATPEAAPVEVIEVFILLLIFTALVIFSLWVHVKHVDYKNEQAWLTRLSNIVQNWSTMCVSWACLLIWKLLVRYMDWFTSCEVIPARILIAFMISYAAFILIWILDKVASWVRSHVPPHKDGFDSDMAVDKIIAAIGLAIGFAWEQSFDTAVDDLGARMIKLYGFQDKSVAYFKFAGACLLCMIVLPAFRLYIQPTLEVAEEGKNKQDEVVRTKSQIARDNTLKDALLAIDEIKITQ